MATELASFGITVDVIAPGWIPVRRHENDAQEDKDAYFSRIAAGRWGVPQDVASAVRFFPSDEASFITGQTLCVNGGMTPWSFQRSRRFSSNLLIEVGIASVRVGLDRMGQSKVVSAALLIVPGQNQACGSSKAVVKFFIESRFVCSGLQSVRT